MTTELTVICRAKVNLTLDVLDRRPDGFHNLESVMQSVDLADILHVERADSGIEVVVDIPGIPAGPGNTVHTACMLFIEATSVKSGVSVNIKKRVPSQAGLGGGSSDAAGALLALNFLFGKPLSLSQLAELAAQVGSDVPFFLLGGTAVVSGRGEHVEPIASAPKLDLVVVKPDVGVPTAWAYRRLADTPGRTSARATRGMVEAITAGSAKEVISGLSNDFQKVVEDEFPQIAEAGSRLRELGALASLLCGSGAAVFGVFPGPDEARRACDRLADIYPFAAAIPTTDTAITIEE